MVNRLIALNTKHFSDKSKNNRGYEMFAGWHGGEYICEQLGFALKRVKDGTAVNMNEKRHAELMQQFFSDNSPMQPPKDAPADRKPEPVVNLFEDVHTWLMLSRIWFERFL